MRKPCKGVCSVFIWAWNSIRMEWILVSLRSVHFMGPGKSEGEEPWNIFANNSTSCSNSNLSLSRNMVQGLGLILTVYPNLWSMGYVYY